MASTRHGDRGQHGRSGPRRFREAVNPAAAMGRDDAERAQRDAGEFLQGDAVDPLGDGPPASGIVRAIPQRFAGPPPT